MAALPIALDSARRILLVKPSALGDVVHALPVVSTLKRRYPEIPLDWLVEEEAAPLVVGHPAVASIVVSGRRRWLRQLRRPADAPAALGEMRSLVTELRRRRYDAVLDLQGLLKSALYVIAAGAPVRVGLADAREGSRWVLTHQVPVPPQPVHAVERYLALAAAVDAREAVREFTIPLSQEDLRAAQELVADLPRPCIALHPATRWETKLWEVERWRAVAASLTGEGAGVVVTGSPADAVSAAAVCQGLRPAPRSLAGRLSLKGLAALFRFVDLVVTVDSGPMHIASAVGTPVVALFGPTDPARTGPLGPGRVLRQPLPCSPCLQRECRIAEKRKCMRDLEVADVLAAVRDLLAAPGQRHKDAMDDEKG